MIGENKINKSQKKNWKVEIKLIDRKWRKSDRNNDYGGDDDVNDDGDDDDWEMMILMIIVYWYDCNACVLG